MQRRRRARAATRRCAAAARSAANSRFGDSSRWTSAAAIGAEHEEQRALEEAADPAQLDQRRREDDDRRLHDARRGSARARARARARPRARPARRTDRSPLLTAIAELRGPRPAANARGCAVGHQVEPRLRDAGAEREPLDGRVQCRRLGRPAARARRPSRARPGRRTTTCRSASEQRRRRRRSTAAGSRRAASRSRRAPRRRRRASSQTLSTFRAASTQPAQVSLRVRPRQPARRPVGLGRVAAARAVERGDVLERDEDVAVQLDVGDVLDVAVRGQHAFLVVAAEERDLDLLALVLVGVVLHRRVSLPPRTCAVLERQHGPRGAVPDRRPERRPTSGLPCAARGACRRARRRATRLAGVPLGDPRRSAPRATRSACSLPRLAVVPAPPSGKRCSISSRVRPSPRADVDLAQARVERDRRGRARRRSISAVSLARRRSLE